jgi:tetratricopeptide (TPR) repeat protein
MQILKRWRHLALVAAALPLAACGDYLEVTNPGPIQDEALNVPEAMEGLVTGMSADVSDALGDLVYATSMMADELTHGGSYTAEGLWYRGIINPDQINDLWADSHRARWTAEQGIERLKRVLPNDWDKTVLGARAHLFAGFANRLLGENMCQAVIDAGSAQDHKMHFQRAEQYFSEALRIAQTLNRADFANAALAGRASVMAWQGNWAEAAQDAQQVPTSFRFDALFSTNSSYEQNDLVAESNTVVGRRELTVFGTIWAERDPTDPRTPWTIPLDPGGRPMRGQDGKTPFYQQMKFTDLGADIPLAQGTEMRMLQAEAALRDGDIATAMGFMNQQRAFYGLPQLPTPASLEEAWDILQVERGAVVWLEARRFWDLRRWFNETGPAHHDFLEGRDKCIPISQNEQESNPNLRG